MIAVVGWLASALLHAAPPAVPADVAAGQYLTRLAGCKDCHTTAYDQFMAGGVRLDNTEFGVFYTPNITPDVETGIGAWTLKDFRRALRKGRSPRHMLYYPVFPYRSYTKLSDRDIANVWAYLRTVPPVRKRNRSHVLNFKLDNSLDSGVFSTRSLVYGWQVLASLGSSVTWSRKIRDGFGPMKPDPYQTPRWNRGAYLVEAAFHCAECHTPRHWPTGLLKTNLWMSGANYKLNGHAVPNITPDELTGLGLWSERTWERFLSSGYRPDGSTVGYEMAWVVQNTAALTPEDRRAVIDYLMHLPAVRSAHE